MMSGETSYATPRPKMGTVNSYTALASSFSSGALKIKIVCFGSGEQVELAGAEPEAYQVTVFAASPGQASTPGLFEIPAGGRATATLPRVRGRVSRPRGAGWSEGRVAALSGRYAMPALNRRTAAWE